MLKSTVGSVSDVWVKKNLDRKTGAGTAAGSGGTLYDHWSADIASATDYYPGGMMMPGRNTEYSWSRMGAQNSPKDDEVYGKGNFVDMGDRHLDTRILRTPKIDAKASKYPSISAYSYAGGNPIYFMDPNGKELVISKVGRYDIAKNDMLSLAGDHVAMFKIENDGTVKTTATRAQIEQTGDAGAILLYDIIKSPNLFKYAADDKASYRTANQYKKDGELMTGPPSQVFEENLDKGSAISNVSKQAYGAYMVDKNGNNIYADKVQVPADLNAGAEITINPNAEFQEKLDDGTIIKKSRESTVLHEMGESYNRTDGKMEYKPAHNKINKTEKGMRENNPNDVRTSNNQGSPKVNPKIKK